MTDRLHFRQLLAGQHYAMGDPIAGQMANFSYLIGDREQGDCLLVDPAWDAAGLVQLIEADGLRLAGVLCTHSHPDHVGGEAFGHQIEGVAEVLALRTVPVHVHSQDAERLCEVTGIDATSLILHEGGDKIRAGEVEIDAIHTPGHTPGGLCFLVAGRLVTGDTLFVMSCGRIDLPRGNPDEMYRTLTERFTALPDTTEIFPGHHYGPHTTSTLGDERRANPCLRVSSLQDWHRMMGV